MRRRPSTNCVDAAGPGNYASPSRRRGESNGERRSIVRRSLLLKCLLSGLLYALGRLRCPWGMSAPEYLVYHDEEWGRPLRGDVPVFERLCLEGFQSGLSWLTILRKRENFRAAFAGFDLAAVAAFGDADVARLLADAGIVRNRAKIEAAIVAAKREKPHWGARKIRERLLRRLPSEVKVPVNRPVWTLKSMATCTSSGDPSAF